MQLLGLTLRAPIVVAGARPLLLMLLRLLMLLLMLMLLLLLLMLLLMLMRLLMLLLLLLRLLSRPSARLLHVAVPSRRLCRRGLRGAGSLNRQLLREPLFQLSPLLGEEQLSFLILLPQEPKLLRDRHVGITARVCISIAHFLGHGFGSRGQRLLDPRAARRRRVRADGDFMPDEDHRRWYGGGVRRWEGRPVCAAWKPLG